jgi:hypothetical protein
MLSDTDAAFVAIALSLRLEKGKESSLIQRVAQTKTAVHAQKSNGRINVE